LGQRYAVASAFLQKQRQDDFKSTQLIIRGIATVPTGRNGGTNPSFLAAAKSEDAPEQ